MPRISDEMLHGVAFLYPTQEQAAQNERVGGTGFLVSRFGPRASKAFGFRASIPFLISNRHVVWNSGCSVARFNRRDGGWTILNFGPENWVVHPDGDDVAAVCVFSMLDRMEDEITTASFEDLITEETVSKSDLGVGDDVYMMGRFINHQGRKTIRPAVRFGNISMMPEMIGNSAINQDQLSYAVEMRSRTGFSGSPVVVYRQKGMSLKELPEGHDTGWGVLGINWGHILDEDGENTWLNGVVPAWKIIEVLQTPEMEASFNKADEAAARISKGAVAVPSVAVEDAAPPTTDENPRHKEDFNSLLDAAVKGSQSDDQT